MRKMSIAREIKINRLQNKNRMTGQTFNVGGHTSESLQEREHKEIEAIKALNAIEYEEKRQYCIWQQKQQGSNLFETNVFIRNFGLKPLNDNVCNSTN
jgi:hypothetical protein